jgi:SAM-dependent methyltransferase
MKYIIDETVSGLERQRLLAQSLKDQTEKFLLNELTWPPRAKCLDLGCGIGETTRLIAAHAGEESEVIGIDADPDLLEAARKLTANANISYQQGDAQKLGFEDARFDFVYTRMLLLHVPDPKAVFAEMLRVAKPGGIVAVTDMDFATFYTYPDPGPGKKLAHLWCALFRDGSMGIKIWHLFNEFGLPSAQFHVDRMLVRNEPEHKKLVVMSIEALRDSALEAGLLTEAEYQQLWEELTATIHDDTCLMGYPEFYCAWAVR